MGPGGMCDGGQKQPKQQNGPCAESSFRRHAGGCLLYTSTISLDETALREALETNPDQVRDAFTKSKDNGAATDGLMTMIQKVTDRYAATTGDVKGILIEKAGSQYSPTAALDNTCLLYTSTGRAPSGA